MLINKSGSRILLISRRNIKALGYKLSNMHNKINDIVHLHLDLQELKMNQDIGFFKIATDLKANLWKICLFRSRESIFSIISII